MCGENFKQGPMTEKYKNRNESLKTKKAKKTKK